MWTHVLLIKACIMQLSATTLKNFSIWEIMWNVIFFEKNWAVILLFRIRGLFCIFALGKKVEKTQNAQVRERLLLYLTSPGHDFFLCLLAVASSCANRADTSPLVPLAVDSFFIGRRKSNPRKPWVCLFAFTGWVCRAIRGESDLQPSTTSLETQTLKGSSPHPNYFQSFRKTCLLSLAAYNLAVKSISNIFRIYSFQKPNY